MSLTAYAHIQKKKIDTGFFLKSVIEFFEPEGEIEISNNGACEIISFIKDETHVNIYFAEQEVSVWYSDDIIAGEFERVQSIIFDPEDEKFFPEWYVAFINYCVLLSKKINSNILFSSDSRDDICLIKENEIIWSQTNTEDIKQLFEEMKAKK